MIPRSLAPYVTVYWNGLRQGVDPAGGLVSETAPMGLVLAFFDIGRGDWAREYPGRDLPKRLIRDNDDYLRHFAFLAKIKNDLIIFTQRPFAEPVLALRRRYGLENRTFIGVIDDLFAIPGIAEMVAAASRNMTRTLWAFVRKPFAPEYWSAKYVVINCLKSLFVMTAIDMRVSPCPQLAWLDFGCCREDGKFDPDRAWTFETNGKINLFYRSALDDRPIYDIVRTGDVYLQGSFVVAPVGEWPGFHDLIDRSYDHLTACGLIDDDQTVLLMAYRANPSAFRLHAGDARDWFAFLRRTGHEQPDQGALIVIRKRTWWRGRPLASTMSWFQSIRTWMLQAASSVRR